MNRVGRYAGAGPEWLMYNETSGIIIHYTFYIIHYSSLRHQLLNGVRFERDTGHQVHVA